MSIEKQTTAKSEPVEISSESYWIGRREGVLLERNIYLRKFKQGQNIVNLVIDPGPPDDLNHLVQSLQKVVGGVKNVNMIFINHQDPDVVYNAAYLQKMNPNCYLLCSEDTWRLIRFYGLNQKAYRAVERFKNMKISLSTGNMLSFVPSPFCHFRGAVMLYDHETRILYTGDLFGGLSYKADMFASEDYWDGVKAFHQIYMPSRKALNFAIENIRALDPPPLMIAPQHGSIIKGELVEYFLSKLSSLDVGLDLFLSSHQKESYVTAMNEMLVEFNGIIGKEKMVAALKAFEDSSFTSIFSADSSGIKDIKLEPVEAVERFVRHFKNLASTPVESENLEMATIRVLTAWNIPIPNVFSNESLPSPEFFDAM
ncbi:MAG: MBL fold metallo-hydrolase [Myxococcota bacterium]